MRTYFSFGIAILLSANFAFATTDKKAASARKPASVESIDPDALIVYPRDKFYPVDKLKKSMRGKVQIQQRYSPWYERKHRDRARIFAAGGMEARIQKDKWDGLDRNLFLQDLDYKGARGIASTYKQFTLQQLQQAEAELRKVKAEP